MEYLDGKISTEEREMRAYLHIYFSPLPTQAISASRSSMPHQHQPRQKQPRDVTSSSPSSGGWRVEKLSLGHLQQRPREKRQRLTNSRPQTETGVEQELFIAPNSPTDWACEVRMSRRTARNGTSRCAENGCANRGQNVSVRKCYSSSKENVAFRYWASYHESTWPLITSPAGLRT